MSLLSDVVIGGLGLAALYNAPLLSREALRALESVLTLDPTTGIEVETVDYVAAGKSEAEKRVEFIVYRDGSLGFMIEIMGSFELSGADERAIMRQKVANALTTHMLGSGVTLQAVFQRDPAQSLRESRRLHRPQRESAARLGLAFDDMFDAKEIDFAKRIESEVHVWCFTVAATVLPSRVRKIAYKNRSAVLASFPKAEDVQRIGAALVELKDRIYGVMSTAEKALHDAGIAYRVLDGRETVIMMADFLNPSMSGGFEPMLPGDPLPTRIHPSIEPNALAGGKPNVGAVLWPALWTQLLREAPDLPTPNIVNLGGRSYAAFSVRLLPTRLDDFQKLLNNMTNDGVPWRISVRMTSDGPASTAYRSTVSGFLKFASTANKQLAAAFERVHQDMIDNVTQVRVQVDLVTWADEGDHALLFRRAEALTAAYQSMGGAQIERQTSRSWLGFLDTCPGVRRSSGANFSCIRMTDALGLVPMGRPASPWTTEPASMLFRYRDGKVLPFDPNSSFLSAKVMVVSGPMGHGKSVTLMAYCMSLITAPGNTDWPYIAFFDIGPGSSGLISLLKSGLPDDKKDYAEYIDLDLDPTKYGMNPFDLPLGYWEPTPSHKKFLVNLLSLLAPKAASHESFLDLIVQQAYRRVAPMLAGGRPNIYAPGYDANVDQLLLAYQEEAQAALVQNGLPWYSVVDILFRHGHIREAGYAQRFAVPNLMTMAGLARDPEIQKLYSEVPGSSDTDTLPLYVDRCLIEAVRMYPYIASPTRIAIGRAKVVAFNLDKIAPKGDSVSAKTETAVAYMVATQLVSGQWKADFDELDKIRPGLDTRGGQMPMVAEYRAYHRKRIQSLKEQPKVYIFDEKHRTKGVPSIERMIDGLYREGRKYRIYLVLASQAIDDFEDTLLKLASVTLILGAGSVEGAKHVSKLFDFNRTTSEYVRDGLVKAGPQGANMVASYTTSKGRFTQFQYLSLGPVEMWSFQSNPDDTVLRNMLYERYTPGLVRIALARRFPSGSAEEEVRKRRIEMGVGAPELGGDDASDAVNMSVLKDIGDMVARDITAKLLS